MSQHDMDETETDLKLNPLERLRKNFYDELKELIKLELDVEELAERKAQLIKAFLKEDVHGVKEFWEDLKAEAHTLEDYVGHWLLKAADPTVVDWVKLEQYIDKGEDRLMAGEVATDVELSCVGCGKIRVADGTITVQPCTSCGCEIYQLRNKRVG